MSAAHSCQRHRVGGPLVGGFDNNNQRRGSGRCCFSPIVTPPFGSDEAPPQQQQPQWILLPHATHVAVLAYTTGQRLATLLVREDGGGGNGSSATAIVTSITVLPTPSHMLVLLGCRDGAVRGFDLAAPVVADNDARHQWEFVPGPIWLPQRTWHVPLAGAVRHLVATITDTTAIAAGTAASQSTVASTQNIVLYVLMESPPEPADKKRGTGATTVQLGQLHMAWSGDLVQTVQSRIIEADIRYRAATVATQKKGRDTTFDLLLQTSYPDDTARASCHGHPHVLVLCRSSELRVYVVDGKNGDDDDNDDAAVAVAAAAAAPPVLLSPPAGMAFTCVQLHGGDLASGLDSGEIRVWNNVLHHVMKSMKNGGRATPASQNWVSRKLHWHAHAVASLAFSSSHHRHDRDSHDDDDDDNDAPVLYSAGEESVLVAWHLARGSSRPTDVLPRIGLGGIASIVSVPRSSSSSSSTRRQSAATAAAVLVYCVDNSLHLYATHNFARLWHIQGLAYTKHQDERGDNLLANSQACTDMRNSGNILLRGLPGAAGALHWYDFASQCVQEQLEVSPYNRVSRTAPGDTPLPAPTVQFVASSRDGHFLATVDTVPSENVAIGAREQTNSSRAVGLVTTLKFWEQGNATDKEPYRLAAAMVYPHGAKNKISALALSSDAAFACTMSNDDRAFRLWRRETRKRPPHVAADGPAWVCDFHVPLPAIMAAGVTGRDAIAFSVDETILAVASGCRISLWDHTETTLLSLIDHAYDHSDTIDLVDFLDTDLVLDFVLSQSNRRVTLQSPYGAHGPSNIGWTWSIPSDVNAIVVSSTCFVADWNVVAVALHDKEADESDIVLIDALSGRAFENEVIAAQHHGLAGRVVSMCTPLTPLQRVATWNDAREGQDDLDDFALMLLSDTGEMWAIATSTLGVPSPQTRTPPSVPRLALLADDASRVGKRPVHVLRASELVERPTKIMAASSLPSLIADDNEQGFPDLLGSLARTFVGRNLTQR